VTLILYHFYLERLQTAVYRNKTLYQTWAKSDNRRVRRSYCDFSMSNLDAFRHLQFDRKWILQFHGFPRFCRKYRCIFKHFYV